MRLVFAILLTYTLMPVVTASDATAQATCRQKCTSEEQACLKRTNNKSQCGGTAQVCLSKCK